MISLLVSNFQANSLQACRRTCTIESEFLCRSFLYTGTPNGNDYNCKLYHLDHWTLADGVGAFLNSNTPLNIANGGRIGQYYENRCERKPILIVIGNCTHTLTKPHSHSRRIYTRGKDTDLCPDISPTVQKSVKKTAQKH